MAVKKTSKKVTKKVTKKVAKKVTKKAPTKKRLGKDLVSSKKGAGKAPSFESMEDRALGINTSDEFVEGPVDPRRILLRSRRIHGNAAKRKIAVDMLERYTGHSIDMFEKQIIITNFHYYIERFNALLDDAEYTTGSAFKASSSKKAGVTIVEFGIGSAMAALIGELLAVVDAKAVLFLGMVGGIHPSLKVGDFILPIASIRAEGVSRHFLPPQVPALPNFQIQKFVSEVLQENGHECRTGTIHTTDFRFWEFDERFKANLIEEKVLGVEMETAALFAASFVSKVNIGALLLVSDCPMKKGGIKTKASANKVFKKYTDIHIELGIQAMADIAERGEEIRHYQW